MSTELESCTGTEDVYEAAELRILKIFLSEKNLRKVMAHLCNHGSSNHVADPVTDTVVMMMTRPVHLVITEVGVALFKVYFFMAFFEQNCPNLTGF